MSLHRVVVIAIDHRSAASFVPSPNEQVVAVATLRSPYRARGVAADRGVIVGEIVHHPRLKMILEQVKPCFATSRDGRIEVRA